ncbi:MAG: MerR family transcriptional regulator [Eubacteriales bacterium]|nr:MerR family transcriptional regulator [Eubacteriales bacterium]
MEEKRFSVQEMSERAGVPAPTLRYYEAQGLLPPVPRTAGGQRMYGQEHIDRLNAIACFKATGLSIARMQDFFAYERHLEENIEEIIGLVETHEQDVERQMEELRQHLLHIHQKVLYYRAVRQAYERKEPLPDFNDFGPGGAKWSGMEE